MNDLIGHNLRIIRKQRDLSLDKLATMSGVSKSMLRQIETGKSNPTISTLWKIANGLHIPLTALLREETADVVLKTFADGALLKGSSDGCRLFTLVPFDPDRAFEVYYLEIDSRAALLSEAHNGKPEEYIFVFQGTLDVTIDTELYTIGSEQFIRFRADRPHKYQNSGTETIKALVMIAYLA